MKIKLSVVLIILFSCVNLFPQEKQNLTESINSELNELAPVISQDSKVLYFIRSNEKTWTESDQIPWYSEVDGNGFWNPAKKLNIPFTSTNSTDVYIVSITRDGSAILYMKDKNNLASEINGLYFAYKYSDGWDTPRKMNIKNFEYFISNSMVWGLQLADNDKVMFLYKSKSKTNPFSEIFISILSNDSLWSEPKYLDGKINKNEGVYGQFTPFLAPDNYSLFFASDRSGGFGSSDIYMSKRLDNTWQRWSEPVNVGDKINTKDWEGYFTISPDGKYCYFVSSNNSFGGNDIYRMKLSPQFLLEPVVVITGKVTSAVTSEQLNAKISYYTVPDSNKANVINFKVNDSKFRIVLNTRKNYRIKIESDGYITSYENINLTYLSNYSEKKLNIELKPIPKIVIKEEPEIITLNDIHFDFGKSEIKSESFSEIDKIIKLMNDNQKMEIEISAHTDNIGTADFNLKLSQDRAESVLNYFVLKGIQLIRLSSTGYGDTKPIAPNDTEEGRQKNRRVEFKILKK